MKEKQNCLKEIFANWSIIIKCWLSHVYVVIGGVKISMSGFLKICPVRAPLSPRSGFWNHVLLSAVCCLCVDTLNAWTDLNKLWYVDIFWYIMTFFIIFLLDFWVLVCFWKWVSEKLLTMFLHSLFKLFKSSTYKI